MEGKVIAITGGASGMGLATPQILSSKGAKVSIADVSEKSLGEAKESIHAASPASEEVVTAKCDVKKFSDVRTWSQATVEKFGKLDGAVNFAGVRGGPNGGGNLDDPDEEDWNQVIAINLTGTMHSMKAELQVMKSGASIVNAASVASLRGIPNAAAYTASKHGIVGLTKSAATDYGPKGIRVNAVAPGYIDTPMMHKVLEELDGHDPFAERASTMPIPRKGTSEEVGRLVAFLLSDEASFITGALYEFDGGWTAKF